MQPQLPITFPFSEFLISPHTSWKRFVNPQFFVTYNLGDAAIENHVLRRAGSYGKQLGKSSLPAIQSSEASIIDLFGRR
jgi:hypothetical protein